MTPNVNDTFIYNFKIKNNSDYSKVWQCLDRTTGLSILETNQTFQLTLKATRDINATALLTLTSAVDTTITGIFIGADVQTLGNLTITFRFTDLEPLLVSGQTSVVFYYDFKIIYPDGLTDTRVQGNLTIEMGIS